jgi:hypothetical protein
MVTSGIPTTPNRPKIIQSMITGFDVAANNIHLLIMPILLDLLLWFGPHISLRNLIISFKQNFDQMPFTDPKYLEMSTISKDLLAVFADRFNLLMSLRTYPVGVPSLMSGNLPVSNPVGFPLMLNVDLWENVIILWLVIALVGLLAGSLFFTQIARAVLKDKQAFNPGMLGWSGLQVLFLTLMCLFFIMIIGVPVMMAVSTLTFLINPFIGQLALFIAGLIMLWIVVPLIFAPHGIFTSHQNFLRSALTSIQVVRFALPGTGLFFLTALVISSGLDQLWGIPKDDSWLRLVGIAGHAFISVGLVASSFVYYKDGLEFVQQIVFKQKPPVENQPG